MGISSAVNHIIPEVFVLESIRPVDFIGEGVRERSLKWLPHDV